MKISLPPFLRPWERPGWRQWVWMALAVVLAHAGCLGSTFFLDDFVQVVEADAVDGHRPWYFMPLRALPYLTYRLNYLAAGGHVSAPSFHAGNLFVHGGVSLALLGFACDFLRRAARFEPARADAVALLAALGFAVHPLCSEIPNYVRARDIALVSLFTLLGARAVLRWEQERRVRWLAAGAAAFAAATASKEVGCIIAGGTMALTWYAAHPFATGRADPNEDNSAPPPARELRFSLPGQPWWWVTGGVGAAVAAAYTLGWHTFGPLFINLSRSLTHPRAGLHLLTQARVFWRYAARVVWPARLCADHQIAWTVSPAADPVAWVSLAGLVAVCGMVGVVLWRSGPRTGSRAAAVLGAVALLDLLHRLANVSGELMVEYRTYPKMGPMCLLLAWAASRAWTTWQARAMAVKNSSKGQSAPSRARVPAWTGPALAAGVLLAGAAWSEQRARAWRDLPTLVADTLAQYPLHARARHELQEDDLRHARWQAALDRQPGIRDALQAAAQPGAAPCGRRYDPEESVMTRLATEGNCAHALARLGRRSEARAQLARLRADMERNGATLDAFWGVFYLASSSVHEAAGQREDALMDLRESETLFPILDLQRRTRRRIEGGQASPDAGRPPR